MKKRGFTLIELLAVIVILAIIALIAIPQITNVIEEARKSAAESSTLGYIDAVEKYIMLHDVDSNKYPYDLRGKTLNVAKNTDISLLDIFVERVYAESAIPSLNEIVNPKGKKPTGGTIVVNEKGKVSNYAIIINGYKVKPKKDANDNLIVDKPVARKMGPITVSYHANGGTGEMADTKDIVAENTFIRSKYEFVSWNDKADGSGQTYTSETPLEDDIDLYAIWKRTYSIGDDLNFDPIENKACDNPVSASETKTGCLKFYVIKVNSDNVDAILDHNTTLAVNWLVNRVPEAIARDTAGWAGNPRLITAYEVASAVGGTFSGGSGSSGVAFYCLPDKQKYHWLFDHTKDCIKNGCQIEDNTTYGYWTSTLTTANTKYYSMDGNGCLSVSDNYWERGIRPVITIQKSVFE